MSKGSRQRRDHKKAVARYKQRVNTERNQLQKQVTKMLDERRKQMEIERQQESNENV